MVNQFAYIGAALMVGFNFTLNPIIGIIGLILLTAQAIQKKLWNLVGLNVAGIIGLVYNLF